MVTTLGAPHFFKKNPPAEMSGYGPDYLHCCWPDLLKSASPSPATYREEMIGKIFILVFAMQHWSEVNAATKPNILMFVMDDLGWNDTSYKGSDIPTPNIDKLANEGIRLQRYYVQRICSPTRSAIMAGRYPYHLGLASDVIHPGHPYGLLLNQMTLANELKKGGYATHIVGK